MDYKCQKCGKTSHNSYMYTHLLNVSNFTDDIYAHDTNSIWLHYFASKPEIYTICKHCVKTTTVLELLKGAVDIEYKQQKK
jgi:hypothetical protein